VDAHLRECLACGDLREQRASTGAAADGCRRCGYVGWAPSAALTEPERRVLRERPVARRRLRLVA
jgi:hypothetical protein